MSEIQEVLTFLASGDDHEKNRLNDVVKEFGCKLAFSLKAAAGFNYIITGEAECFKALQDELASDKINKGRGKVEVSDVRLANISTGLIELLNSGKAVSLYIMNSPEGKSGPNDTQAYEAQQAWINASKDIGTFSIDSRGHDSVGLYIEDKDSEELSKLVKGRMRGLSDRKFFQLTTRTQSMTLQML